MRVQGFLKCWGGFGLGFRFWRTLSGWRTLGLWSDNLVLRISGVGDGALGMSGHAVLWPVLGFLL